MSTITLDLAPGVGWFALGLTCVIAFWRGGRAERLGAILAAAGWIVTPFVEIRTSWYQPQVGIFAVDVFMLLALTALTLRYRRAWTVCASAFQALMVLTHIGFLVNPTGLYRAYYFANFSIGFLVLGAIVGGVLIEDSAWLLRLSGPLGGSLGGPRRR
jgi:hypothetical protein